MSFVISVFDPTTQYDDYSQFDCGHKIINDYVKKSLKQQINKNVSVAYALLETGGANPNGRFVGFFNIVAHAIPLSSLSVLQLGSLPRIIPCVRLVMLGVSKHDAGKGLGKQLMNHAFDVMKATASGTGCLGMYLDADPNAVSFYTGLGFDLLDGDKSPLASPMFLPLTRVP